MIVGYDPGRVGTLAWKSREALWALSVITSSDPAASGAVAAVRRLHRSIENGVLAAADDLIASAPLVRSFGSRSPATARFRYRPTFSAVDRYESPTTSGTVSDLFEDLGFERLALSYIGLGDDELLDRLEDRYRTIRDLGNDHRSAFWTRELPAWVIEFERRTAADPAFAARLVDESTTNPLIGEIVARADLSDELVLGVLTAMIHAPTRPFHAEMRVSSVHALFGRIDTDVDLAMQFLTAPTNLQAALGWNHGTDERTSAGLDATIANVLRSVLTTPFDEPHRLADSRVVLGELISASNTSVFERGFAPPVALGVTEGLLPHLPFLVATASLDGPMYFRDFAGVPDRAFEQGDVVDFVGALLRDPESSMLLLGSIGPLTAGAGRSGDTDALYVIDDMVGYVDLLSEAGRNEQLEETLVARRSGADWNERIDLVETAVGTALTASGGGAPGGAAIELLANGSRWLAGLIDAHDLGLADFDQAAMSIFSVALATRIADRRRAPADRDTTDDDVDLDTALALVARRSRELDERRAALDRSRAGGDGARRSADETRVVNAAARTAAAIEELVRDLAMVDEEFRTLVEHDDIRAEPWRVDDADL